MLFFDFKFLLEILKNKKWSYHFDVTKNFKKTFDDCLCFYEDSNIEERNQ